MVSGVRCRVSVFGGVRIDGAETSPGQMLKPDTYLLLTPEA